MFDADSLRHRDELPGYLGPMAEVHPAISVAWVRPYIWANLLYLGEVRSCEIEGQLAQVVPTDDLRPGLFSEHHHADYGDRSRLQVFLDQALAEEVAAGRLNYDEDSDHYRIAPGDGLRLAISAACTLNSQLPVQLLNDRAATDRR
ncbi:MAG: hypothetical protein ACPGSE_00125 [Synechococcus sp.]